MNYRTEAINLLLNEDCILKRYYPLIPYKKTLIENFGKMGYKTKDELKRLSDEELIKTGLTDKELVMLFRRFLVLYDVSESKLKDIEKESLRENEIAVFKELYQLPGVKQVRASLYCKAGYDSLEKIAAASFEKIISDISDVIAAHNLKMAIPLVKEVKTHIAVAKALTEYKAVPLIKVE